MLMPATTIVSTCVQLSKAVDVSVRTLANTQKDECSSEVACPVDILILPVRNGNAPANEIPSAMRTEPQQHATNSFLDVRLCPKSG